MTRRLVSYEDVVDDYEAAAGPSSQPAMDSSMGVYDDDDDDDDDDEMAPLPQGVKRSAPKDGGGRSKLTPSAKKRLKKKRAVERKNKNGPTEATPRAVPPPQISSSDKEPQVELSYEHDGEAGNGDEQDEEYYDEEYDYEDGEEDFALHTNIMIPDIPAHMLPQFTSRNPRIATAKADTTPLVPDPTGRALQDEEITADSVLVDAWSAAITMFSGKNAITSPLWNFAPIPGSIHHRQMKSTASDNKEKRRLRKFVSEQAKVRNGDAVAETAQVDQAVVSDSAQMDQDVVPEPAQIDQVVVSQPAQIDGPSSSIVSKVATAATAAPAAPTGTATPPIFKLNRAIPPSIGLEGNAAWQAACAKVASTKNRIGPPVVNEQPSVTAPALPPPPAGSRSMTDEETFQQICTSWYNAGYYTALWQQQKSIQ